MFKKEIDKLELYLGNEDQDANVTLAVIAKLRDIEERAKSASWTKSELEELNFSTNDPLDIPGAEDLPEMMRDEIRQIQHGIINYYADTE